MMHRPERVDVLALFFNLLREKERLNEILSFECF